MTKRALPKPHELPSDRLEEYYGPLQRRRERNLKILGRASLVIIALTGLWSLFR